MNAAAVRTSNRQINPPANFTYDSAAAAATEKSRRRSRSRSRSSSRSDKKRITVQSPGPETSDGNSITFFTILKETASVYVEMFLQKKPFDQIATTISKIHGGKGSKYRKHLAMMNTESECAEARKKPSPTSASASGLSGYKTSKEIDNENQQNDKITKATAKSIVSLANGDQKYGWSWKHPFFSNINVPFALVKEEGPDGKMKQEQFSFDKAILCGNCHICKNPVYSFANNKYHTACGECEHKGAMIATLFAGFLASGGNDSMVHGYDNSDVHCNRAKGNLVPAKFNIKTHWEFDKERANEIAEKIINGVGTENKPNASEYNYFRLIKHKQDISSDINKNAAKTKIVSNLEESMKSWIAVANKDLKNATKTKPTGDEKTKVALYLTNTLLNLVERGLKKKVRGGVRTPKPRVRGPVAPITQSQSQSQRQSQSQTQSPVRPLMLTGENDDDDEDDDEDEDDDWLDDDQGDESDGVWPFDEDDDAMDDDKVECNDNMNEGETIWKNFAQKFRSEMNRCIDPNELHVALSSLDKTFEEIQNNQIAMELMRNLRDSTFLNPTSLRAGGGKRKSRRNRHDNRIKNKTTRRRR